MLTCRCACALTTSRLCDDAQIKPALQGARDGRQGCLPGMPAIHTDASVRGSHCLIPVHHLSFAAGLQLALVRPQTIPNKQPLPMLAALSAYQQLALGRLQSIIQHSHSHDLQSMSTSPGRQQERLPACTAHGNGSFTCTAGQHVGSSATAAEHATCLNGVLHLSDAESQRAEVHGEPLSLAPRLALGKVYTPRPSFTPSRHSPAYLAPLGYRYTPRPCLACPCHCPL